VNTKNHSAACSRSAAHGRALLGHGLSNESPAGYGIHWCLNIVCGTQPGSAALIRAIEPAAGIDTMIERRGSSALHTLCSGPGRLCQALAIDGTLDGLPIDQPPFMLTGLPNVDIKVGKRIGLTRGMATQWRFWLKRSPYVSRSGGKQ
jgi:DNA-3-methyladenine glycosylase